MEKPVLISDEVNYAWNFLNYPIHTITAKPKEESSKSCAILLIHGFGASTDHWRFNIPVLSHKYEVHACLLYTSDAADDSLRVDLGGRRIIKNNCLLNGKTSAYK